MTGRVLRLGTRRSTLARTQSEHVAEQLRAAGAEVDLVEIVTEGDVNRAPLASIGGTGVFVGALRAALLEGRVDLAVHSLKDLPTQHEADLDLVVPPREDPRDALVARDGLTLGELPAGSVVGTGSPRRAAQLHALGLGLEVVPVRGNVDTRLAKVAAGDLDGVVLARAGLARLGRVEEITEAIDPLQMLPAPGQGALGVECADRELGRWLRETLEVDTTPLAVAAERALLRRLEAGCSAPVGALAEVVEGEEGEELWLRAIALSADGTLSIRNSHTGAADDPERVGRELAEILLADGAADLIVDETGRDLPVLVPDAASHDDGPHAPQHPPDPPGTRAPRPTPASPASRRRPEA